MVAAGLLEIVWAVGLKYTAGFTRLGPSAVTLAAIVVSFYLLSIATRELPIGTAYAVWVGIGAAGTAVVGMVALGEPVSPARIFFLCLLGVAIVGLKVSVPSL